MTAYSQRDSRWSDKPLGSGMLTIGQAGCLISSAAAMLTDAGADLDPDRLNASLTKTGGYWQGDALIFAALHPWGVQFLDLITCLLTPAPLDRLIVHLAAGLGFLAEVDFYPGGEVQAHWVLVRSLTATDGAVMDPWQLPGQEETRLARYLAGGWDSARGILRAALYQTSHARKVQTPITRGPHQPAMHVLTGCL